MSDGPKMDKSFKLNGIFIEILSDCNLFCKHCYNGSGYRDSIIKKEVIDKIISELDESDEKIFILSGGEPFLHPEIWGILDSISKKRFKIRVVTNGTLLNSDIVEKLKKYDLELQISLNGSKSEIDKEIRGSNAFESTVKGISLLKETRQIDKVIVNYVLNSFNFLDVDNVIKLLDGFGVKKINFNFIISLGRGKMNYDELSLDAKTLNKTIDNIRKISELRKDITFKVPQAYSGCSLIVEKGIIPVTIRIDVNGNVYPCQLFESRRELSIGNIYNEEIVDIINGKKMRDIINFMSLVYNYNENCSKCSWKYECKRGCPAKLISNGITEGTDDLCSLRKLSFRGSLNNKRVIE